MRVLVVGSGGREHALCWRLAQSESLEALFCAPGNPGTATCATNVAIGVDQIEQLVEFAIEERIDVTLVGPEAPLCAGIADRFAQDGLLVAGPTRAAAELEGSKVFAKEFMERHRIPTASFGVFDQPDAAKAYIAQNPEALVVKADGLAAGKGVIVAPDQPQAKAAVDTLFERYGGPVLVEHRLRGEELSIIALCDGETLLPLASSQDHKRALDGDQGPNTGGMGAYSPAPLFDDALQKTVIERVLLPTVRGMADEGRTFRGVLYAGLMIVEGQPFVLEYNCRFGDPETQVLMARLQDDLAQLCMDVARGTLQARPLRWDDRSAVCVVMASDGYPGSYDKGIAITGVDKAESEADVTVFHAGTKTVDGALQTAGGRVLGVTALGDGLAEARKLAYQAVDKIHWPDAKFRSDIGARGLQR
jgi:phosphoribosylamine--glycine ligase